MASTYLVEQLQQQKQLLKELIFKELSLEEGNPNFAIAWDFCTSNLNPKYHNCKDTDAHDISRLYEALSTRLEQNGQLSKAAGLQQLVAQLTKCEPAGAQQEPCAAILSLLFHLANKPLESPQVTWQLDSITTAWRHVNSPGQSDTTVSHDDADTVGEVSSSEAHSADLQDEYAESSDLSDWDVDDHASPATATPQGNVTSQQAVPVQPCGSLATGPSTACRSGQQACIGPPQAAVKDVPVSLLRPADPLVAVATPKPRDLVPCLTRCRLTQALVQPQSALCLTDQYLVHQVCNLLATGHSPCFKWQAAPGASVLAPGMPPSGSWQLHGSFICADKYGQYHALPGLHTPHLSQGMLASVMSQFAATASQLAWMRALIHSTEQQADAMAHQACVRTPAEPTGMQGEAAAAGAAGTQAQVVFTATCCALLQGVQAQIHQVMQPVITIQQTSRFPQTGHGNSNSSSSAEARSAAQGVRTGVEMGLLQLQTLLAGFTRHIQSLHDLLQGALQRYTQVLGQHHLIASSSSTAPSRAAASTPLVGMPSQSASASGRAGAGQPPQQATKEQLAATAARAHASSAIIDLLCEQLQVAPVTSGPHGMAAQQHLLHVLCCALGPLLSSLQAWLNEGLESHSTAPADDFFIAANMYVSETDPLFWSHGHTLLMRPSSHTSQLGRVQPAVVPGGSSGSHDTGNGVGAVRPGGGQGVSAAEATRSLSQVACPHFLQPVARHILSAGKAKRLLQTAGQASTTPGMSSLLAAVPGLLLPPQLIGKRHTGAAASARIAGDPTAQHTARYGQHVTAARAMGSSTTPAVDLQLQFLQQLHQHLAYCLVSASSSSQPPAPGMPHAPGTASVTVWHSQPTSPGRMVSPRSHLSAAAEMSEDGFAAMSHFERMAAVGVAMSSLQPWEEGEQPSSVWSAPWARRHGIDGSTGCWDCEREDDVQRPVPATISDQDQLQKQQQPQLQAQQHEHSMQQGQQTASHQDLLLPGGGLPAQAAATTTASDTSSPAEPANMNSAVDAAADGYPAADGPKPLTVWMQDIQRGLHSDAPAIGWTALSAPHSGHPPVVQAHQAGVAAGQSQSRPKNSSTHGRVQSACGAVTCLLPAQHPHRLLAWLLRRPCVHTPPLSQLLEDCLLQPLHIRVSDAEQQLLGCLMSSWGLMAELKALRNLYLMAAPAAQAWASRLLGSILGGRPLEQHHAYELETFLQEAYGEVVDEAEEALPAIDCLSVVLDTARVHKLRADAATSEQMAAQLISGSTTHGPAARVLPMGGLHSVMELEALQVAYTPSWLMSILGPAQVLTSYNQVWVFLLQINAARMALDRVRLASLKFWQAQARITSLVTTHARQQNAAQSRCAGQNQPPGAVGNRPTGLSNYLFQQRQQQQWELLAEQSNSKGPSAGVLGQAARRASAAPVASQLAEVALTRQDEVVLQDMVHFVSNLHTYVVDKLLYGAWLQLQQELDKVSSLDGMVMAHQTFMSELEAQSGNGGSAPAAKTWQHLVKAVLKLLDQVLRYCAGLQVLMEQLGFMNLQIAATVPQASSGPSDKTMQPNRPPSQEAMRLARQQVTSSQCNMQHLRNYLVTLINNMSTSQGSSGDTTELRSIVLRVHFGQLAQSEYASHGA